MYTVIQAVQSILYIIAKCHFFNVVTCKKKIQGYFFNPNTGLSLLGHIFRLFFQFLCYPASGSNVTTQCLGRFFSVTQILGQSNPAVGLFIAGILHHLLERAVLSAIKLKHFFGKYRFVYILF